MPEIGTSSSMSEDGKRGVGHRPQATAPILDSTEGKASGCPLAFQLRGDERNCYQWDQSVAGLSGLSDAVVTPVLKG